MTTAGPQSELEISQLIETVFPFVTDLKNLPQFWSGVVKVEEVQFNRMGVGSTYIATVKYFLFDSKILLSVTSFTPPTNFTFKDQKSNIDFEFTFSPKPNGTKVFLRSIAENPSLAFSKYRLDRILSNLKRVLESK